MLRFPAALALAAALAAGPARAQAPSPYAPRPEQPGFSPVQTYRSFDEHNGLYFNLSLGYGGISSGGKIPQGSPVDDRPGDLSIKGSGVGFGIAFGGSVSPGSVIGVHAFGLSASSFTLRSPSITGTNRDGATFTLAGFGPTLVLYSSPSNMFFQVTPAVSRLTMDTGTGLSSSTSRGLGLYLALGGEWYLAPKWGLGLVGFTMLSTNKVEDTTIRSAAFGGALSLTLN